MKAIGNSLRSCRMRYESGASVWGQRVTSPAQLRNNNTSSQRELTPSFRKMRCSWLCTVLGLVRRPCAICWLLSPAKTRKAMSCSTKVSAAGNCGGGAGIESTTVSSSMTIPMVPAAETVFGHPVYVAPPDAPRIRSSSTRVPMPSFRIA